MNDRPPSSPKRLQGQGPRPGPASMSGRPTAPRGSHRRAIRRRRPRLAPRRRRARENRPNRPAPPRAARPSSVSLDALGPTVLVLPPPPPTSAPRGPRPHAAVPARPKSYARPKSPGVDPLRRPTPTTQRRPHRPPKAHLGPPPVRSPSTPGDTWGTEHNERARACPDAQIRTKAHARVRSGSRDPETTRSSTRHPEAVWVFQAALSPLLRFPLLALVPTLLPLSHIFLPRSYSVGSGPMISTLAHN